MAFPPITLAVSGLGCQRGGRTLFRDVSFVLNPGELVTLVGPNGAGKSTMIRMIAGLTTPDAGSMTISGGDADAEAASLLHYHGHREGLREALTAAENLAFSTAVLGGDVTTIAATLDRMGARRLVDLPVRVLSAGQRRRVALAKLLTCRRPLWLLDEPLAALDVAGQNLVADLLSEHAAAGGAALVATHQPLGIDSRQIIIGASQVAA